MVIWIIGLSGSGKSYLSKKIYTNISNKKKILLDGDEIRKHLTYKLGYAKKDRLKNSIFIADLCSFLEKKKFVVICAILSIFPEQQKKNRKRFNKYFQIFMDVNKEMLLKRNNKKVYNSNNVVGKNITFPKPYKNDLIIKNEYKKITNSFVKKIISKINVPK
tara:strand:+ start:1436 stop:1921 length:486 start_codon:yes stop_codon:yes gene_type:complete